MGHEPTADRQNEHDQLGAPRVFVPCPVCKQPIELPADRALPRALACPECGAALRMPSPAKLTLVTSEPRRATG
jgi:hypothetical protein